jgi:hypothetical protein
MREREKLGEALPRTNLGSLCSCSKGNYYAAGEMRWRLVFCKFGWQGERGAIRTGYAYGGGAICINGIRKSIGVLVPKAYQELDTA